MKLKSAGKIDKTHYNTYSTFPQRLYSEFVQTYVVPYGRGFTECLDLGCGSGGLLREVVRLYKCNATGLDISKVSIDYCMKDPSFQKPHIRFIQDDILNLSKRDDFRGRFDLIVSHSVLHLVDGDTASKFKLLKDISRAGALIFVDALPRTLWNAIFFQILGFVYRMGFSEIVMRLLGPIVLPNRSKAYHTEFSKLQYVKHLRTSNYIDVGYLKTKEFAAFFELLRLDIIQQDTFLTGRKVRFTIRRNAVQNVGTCLS